MFRVCGSTETEKPVRKNQNGGMGSDRSEAGNATGDCRPPDLLAGEAA